MNRATGVDRAHLRNLYLYVAGMILVCFTVLLMEMTYRSTMHTVHFYHLIALVTPVVLAAIARRQRLSLGGHGGAGVYSVFVLLMKARVLPLFSRATETRPGVTTSSHDSSRRNFPLLLIVPAVVLDLLWQRTARWGAWRQALVSGAVFLAVFAAVQWPFADFLMLPAARNWFFGAKYFGYYAAPSSVYVRNLFFAGEAGGEFLAGTFSHVRDCHRTTPRTRRRRLDAPHPTMKTLLLLTLAAPLAAHIGSPDVFFEGDAGPYKLLVTIRPPQVIPGVAEIEITGLSDDVREVPHRPAAPLRRPAIRARARPCPTL